MQGPMRCQFPCTLPKMALCEDEGVQTRAHTSNISLVDAQQTKRYLDVKHLLTDVSLLYSTPCSWNLQRSREETSIGQSKHTIIDTDRHTYLTSIRTNPFCIRSPSRSQTQGWSTHLDAPHTIHGTSRST